MTKHEDRKRELAEKATPEWMTDVCFGTGGHYANETDENPEWMEYESWSAQGPELRIYFHNGPYKGTQMRWQAGNDQAFIAFHDPVTALLEAEVIATARKLLAELDWEDESIVSREHIKKTLAALDAHHTKRNGGEE